MPLEVPVLQLLTCDKAFSNGSRVSVPSFCYRYRLCASSPRWYLRLSRRSKLGGFFVQSRSARTGEGAEQEIALVGPYPSRSMRHAMWHSLYLPLLCPRLPHPHLNSLPRTAVRCTPMLKASPSMSFARFVAVVPCIVSCVSSTRSGARAVVAGEQIVIAKYYATTSKVYPSMPFAHLVVAVSSSASFVSSPTSAVFAVAGRNEVPLQGATQQHPRHHQACHPRALWWWWREAYAGYHL